MALGLAGDTAGIQERIEGISYTPNSQYSTDLETGTKAITATSEASGLANADYSSALTLPRPADARLAVKRIAARLAVAVDSFDGATHLYCRVYLDQQDAAHMLFDEDWTGTGTKLAAVDTQPNVHVAVAVHVRHAPGVAARRVVEAAARTHVGECPVAVVAVEPVVADPPPGDAEVHPAVVVDVAGDDRVSLGAHRDAGVSRRLCENAVTVIEAHSVTVEAG